MYKDLYVYVVRQGILNLDPACFEVVNSQVDDRSVGKRL